MSSIHFICFELGNVGHQVPLGERTRLAPIVAADMAVPRLGQSPSHPDPDRNTPWPAPSPSQVTVALLQTV
jgi:hypothetical protein